MCIFGKGVGFYGRYQISQTPIEKGEAANLNGRFSGVDVADGAVI